MSFDPLKYIQDTEQETSGFDPIAYLNDNEVELDTEVDKFSVFGFLHSEDPKDYQNNLENFFNQNKKNAAIQLRKILGSGFKVEEDVNLFLPSNKVKITKRGSNESIEIDFALDKKQAADYIYRSLVKKSSNDLFSFLSRTMSQEDISESEQAQEDVNKIFRKATAEGGALYVSEDEKIKAGEEFDDPNLFKPRTETKSVFDGSVSRTISTEVMPYEKEKKAVRKSLINQGVENPTEKQVEDIVRNNLKKQAAAKLFDEKASVYMNSDEIEETDVDAILKLGSLIAKKENSKRKRNIATTQAKLKPAIEKIKNQLNDENSDISKAKEFLRITESSEPVELPVFFDEPTVTLKNGTVMSEEDYNSYVSSVLSSQEDYKRIESLQDELFANIEKAENIDIQADLIGRNYNDMQKFFYLLGSGFGRIVTSGAYGASKLQSGIFGVDNENLDEMFLDMQESNQAYKDKFQKDVAFRDSFNSLEGFGRFIAQEFANQIPIFATLAIPTVGIYSLGASAAGDRWLEIVQQDKELGNETGLLNKMLQSVGYGAAEIVFDRYLTLPVMQRSASVLFGKGGRDLIEGGIKNYFKAFAKRQLVYDPLLEMSAEGLTTLTQNMISGRPLTENLDHAMFSGLMFGGVFGGTPFAKGLVMQKFSDYSSYNGYRNNLKNITDLELTLKKLNTSLKANKTKGNNTTNLESSIDFVTNEISRLKIDNENILQEVDKKTSNLSKYWFDVYNAITVEQEKIRIRVEGIINDDTITNDKKTELLNIAQAEFNKLQSSRDILRDEKNFGNAYSAFRNSNNKKDVARLEEIMSQATTELINEGKAEPTNDDIDTRSRIIFNKQEINKDYNSKKDKISKNFKNFQTLEQAKNFIDSMNISDADKETIKNNFDEGAHGVNVVDLDGNVTPMQIVENMAKADRLETRTHELGHEFLFKVFGQNKAAFKGIANQLLDFVQQRDENLYFLLIGRVERDKDGNLVDEEVIANFLELAAEGRFNNKTKGLSFFANLLNLGVKKATKNELDLNFDGENDAVNFLINLGKKLKAGTVKREDIVGIKKSIAKTAQEKETTEEVSKRDDAEFTFSKQITPEKLIRIIKNPNSKPSKVAGANKELLRQYNALALKALGYDASIGDIPRENVVSALSVYLPGLIQRFKPGRAKFSTLVTTSIAFKKQEVYEQAKVKEKQDTQSLNDSFNQIQDDTLTDLENDVLPELDEKVSKVNVLQIDKIASKSDDIIKSINEKGNFRTVIDNNIGIVGNIIFDIPNQKISNPADNITIKDIIVDNEGNELKKSQLNAGIKGIPVRSEAKKIQDFFRNINAAKNFIKILPLTNVTEKDADINKLGEGIEVSREILGRAIGLPNKILEYFYNKKFKPNGKRARSQGKSSQVPLWELKPRFKNLTDKELTIAAKQFQQDLGVNGDKIVRSGNILSGQFIKGAAVVMSQQASLSAAQRVKEQQQKQAQKAGDIARAREIAQEIADITTAQSKKAFSKQPKVDTAIDFVLNPSFESDIVNVNSLLKSFIGKGKYTFTSKEDVEVFFEQVEKVLISSLPQGYITKRILRPSGRVLGGNRNKQIIVDGKKMTIDSYYAEKRDKLLSRKDLVYGKPFTGKAAKFKAQAYNKVFGNSAKEFEKAQKDGRIKEFNEINASMHRQLWERVRSSIRQNKQNARVWGNYFGTVSLITEHPHRLGAEWVGWSPKPRGFNGKLYEWEHAMPASRAYLYLLESILDDDFNSSFDVAYQLVMDNYKLIALDNYIDKTSIKEAGRTTSMGEGWSILTDSWLDRYFSGDINIDPRTIVSVDGVTFDKAYNITPKTNYSKAKKISTAIVNSRSVKNYEKSRGMSTFDFDETVAISDNVIIATKDGETKRIASNEWPFVGDQLMKEGWKMDFTDFNRVTDGRPGPLMQKLKNQIKKFGPKNVYILTARAPESEAAIHAYLKSEGINLPIENITGLGNSTGEAKALWMLDKFAQGYNDMYFVDDALPNVKAVKEALEQLDIKSKVVQAKINFSKNMNGDFNKILEDVSGIEADKRFSEAKSRKRGEGKGRFRFFVPPSHEDFVGLLYNFIGKGEAGNKHRDFFERSLIKPLNRAFRELNAAKQSITTDYRSLLKNFPETKRKLNKLVPEGDFYYSDAIRVYLWSKAGFDIPGLSKTDKQSLIDLVNSDGELKAFADNIGLISKAEEGYVEPSENWIAGDIRTDLADATGRVGRAKFFNEFIENADIIFSSENINKIRAIYGDNFVEALNDMLYRIKNGTNRTTGNNKMVNAFLNYLNGSIGATMFFNARSAVLQTISTVNFINFGDNNIFKAAQAFSDQTQFWSDFVTIFNSDFLRQRRAGVSYDVNAAEIAKVVSKAKNPTEQVRAAVRYLLQVGFLPTQLADSFAIALGGSSMYRNRVKTYIKQGMSQKQAETKAFEDFQEIAESTQQSARPDMISQQQASPLGRMILAFQNVTSQYTRLMKKSGLDLINRRISPPYKTQVQSDMANVSKIIYYGAVQNIIFYGLQGALFSMMFDDEEKDEELFDKKRDRLLQGSIDSILRGSGVAGAVLSTIKNAAIRFAENQKKDWGKEDNLLMVELLQLSPPIGIKVRKLRSFERNLDYNEDVIKEMNTFDIDNPSWEAYANLIEGTTNVPVARLHRKIQNVRAALDSENQWWQRLAVGLGWSRWELGIENEAVEDVRQKVKEQKEQIRNEKRKQKQKVKDLLKKQCKRIKDNGERCKVRTSNKSGFCFHHD